MVLPVASFAVIVQNPHGHELGFIILVHGGVQLQLVPCPGIGPQFLAFAALIVSDDRVGCLKNVTGGAIVLFQPDDPGSPVLLFKG